MAPTTWFGHVDLRVADMRRALPFFEAMLPALGFGREERGESWVVFYAEGDMPAAPFFAFTEERDHIPNENRIAFAACSRDEVDRLGKVVRDAGAKVESGPRACPDYSPSYYAIFFKDPSGNRFEFYHRTD